MLPLNETSIRRNLIWVWPDVLSQNMNTWVSAFPFCENMLSRRIICKSRLISCMHICHNTIAPRIGVVAMHSE